MSLAMYSIWLSLIFISFYRYLVLGCFPNRAFVLSLIPAYTVSVFCAPPSDQITVFIASYLVFSLMLFIIGVFGGTDSSDNAE